VIGSAEKDIFGGSFFLEKKKRGNAFRRGAGGEDTNRMRAVRTSVL
jgi:hypothetical protein